MEELKQVQCYNTIVLPSLKSATSCLIGWHEPGVSLKSFLPARSLPANWHPAPGSDGGHAVPGAAARINSGPAANFTFIHKSPFCSVVALSQYFNHNMVLFWYCCVEIPIWGILGFFGNTSCQTQTLAVLSNLTRQWTPWVAVYFNRHKMTLTLYWTRRDVLQQDLTCPTAPRHVNNTLVLKADVTTAPNDTLKVYKKQNQ